MAFLKEAHEYSSPEDWKSENISKRALRILERVEHGRMKRQELPLVTSGQPDPVVSSVPDQTMAEDQRDQDQEDVETLVHEQSLTPESELAAQCNVLLSYENQESGGTLTSCFIKDDPVLLESDRSYLEGRRLRQYLLALQGIYNLNGCVHTAGLIIIFIFMLLTAISSGIYRMNYLDFPCNESIPLFPEYIWTAPGTIACDEDIPHMAIYLFIFFPLVIGSAIFSVLGILLWAMPRYCLGSPASTTRILYQMYAGILVVHMCLLAVSLLLVGFGIRLVVGYLNYFERKMKLREVQRFCLMSFVLSLAVSVLLFALLLTAALTRWCCPKYMWQWIFFDSLCRRNSKKGSNATRTHYVRVS